MPEPTDFRAWLDRREREAHEAIAQTYAEGKAALAAHEATEGKQNDESPSDDDAAQPSPSDNGAEQR